MALHYESTRFLHGRLTHTLCSTTPVYSSHHPSGTCTDHQVAAKPASILLAGYPTIDWFFLDVEGAEMFILKAWEWDKPPVVRRWSIESNKLDQDALVTFMKGKGYDCYHADKVNTICDKK